MSWVSAQAGNRASKTRHYLQWWDSNSEQDAMTSASQHTCNTAHFALTPAVTDANLRNALTRVGNSSQANCLKRNTAMDDSIGGS